LKARADHCDIGLRIANGRNHLSRAGDVANDSKVAMALNGVGHQLAIHPGCVRDEDSCLLPMAETTSGAGHIKPLLFG
jgi:hypothetical protein